MEEKIDSVDTKVTQLVDALLGNPLTKAGGIVKELENLKDEIKTFKEETHAEIHVLRLKINKQEDFKKRVYWAIGIVISIGLILQYIINTYNSLHK